VVDAAGEPLAGATITLRTEGASDRVAYTRPDGSFAFTELRPEAYSLTATYAGLAPAHRTFQLKPGQTVTVSLTLLVQAFERTIVTAGKSGEQEVQAMPLAVSVLQGPELRRAQAHTLRDIAGSAPSMTFSQNSGFGQLTIRGIGTNVVFSGSDPSSAVYVDGVYLARPAMVLGDLLDLDRIEVLRGPQGTLYGRNAMGGAVNLITRPPTNVVEAAARVTAGNLNAIRAEAHVGGPIVKDRLLGSISFVRGTRDGDVRDVDHPDHPLGGEDVTAARAKLHVVFGSRSDLLVGTDVTDDDQAPLSYSKVLAVKPGFQLDNPPRLHDVRTSTLAEGRNLQYGTSARLTVRFTPSLTLTSLLAYRALDYDLTVDADISELDLVTSHVHELQHQASEELTLAYSRSRLTWIGGLFLLNDADRQPTVVTFDGPQLENHLDPSVDATSAAVFGQATVPLTRRLSVTAGLRYTREHKTIENAGHINTLGASTVLPATVYAYTDARADTAWTPKAGIEFQAGRQTMAYASATRGFKSGGFNPSLPVADGGYAPEWAWSYEAGIKSLVAQTTLRVAAFWTDYRDLQVQTAIRPGVLDISNAAAATIRGVELEGARRLATAWHIGGHLAWLDAKYDRYVAVGVGGITGDVAGRRLNNAPEWSGRVWLDWSRDIGRSATLSCHADSRWQSTVFFTPFNDPVQRQGAYGLLDGRADIGPKDGRWTIGVYARNLTGADYITGTFSSPPPAIGGRPGDRPHVGIQFSIGRQGTGRW
jgi:iron complex outermembrane receptor protein